MSICFLFHQAQKHQSLNTKHTEQQTNTGENPISMKTSEQKKIVRWKQYRKMCEDNCFYAIRQFLDSHRLTKKNEKLSLSLSLSLFLWAIKPYCYVWYWKIFVMATIETRNNWQHKTLHANRNLMNRLRNLVMIRDAIPFHFFFGGQKAYKGQCQHEGKNIMDTVKFHHNIIRILKKSVYIYTSKIIPFNGNVFDIILVLSTADN